MSDRRSIQLAQAEALTVTLLWSTTFIFVKIGLPYLSPLALAGLRYFGGFLALLPLLLVQNRRRGTPALPRHAWARLILMGLIAFPVGNGLLFWSVQLLPATTVSFLLSSIPLLVLVFGAILLNELPTRRQVWGLAVALAGGAIFFGRGTQWGDGIALGAALLGAAALALFSIIGRDLARDGEVDMLTLTAVPLAVGGGLLLLMALPGAAWQWNPTSIGVVLWLTLLNTALAYVLWNRALRHLKAFEANAVVNLAPICTALLAWPMLGERLTPIEFAGMGIAIAGVILVSLRPAEA